MDIETALIGKLIKMVKIINFMINKGRQGKAQTGRENINIIDTSEFSILLLH